MYSILYIFHVNCTVSYIFSMYTVQYPIYFPCTLYSIPATPKEV